MTDDARFEDVGQGEAPVALRALDADDLKVIAALVQDAVFPAAEMKWDRQRRRFAILLNRYRWELGRSSRERVRSVLMIEDALRVASEGVPRGDEDTVLSLLTLTWTPGEDGTGRILMVLAGDGDIAIDVEALGVTLRDVTKPYAAPSGKAPDHPQ